MALANGVRGWGGHLTFLRKGKKDLPLKSCAPSLHKFLWQTHPMQGTAVEGENTYYGSSDTIIGDRPIINLPPKRVHLTKVEFSSEERTFYQKLEFDSRKQFKAYAAAGTVNQNYANILLMHLRPRQACDHPLLVKGLSSDPIGKDSSEMAKMLPRELLVNLLNCLEASLAICLVCINIKIKDNVHVMGVAKARA